jgi:radical SAM-linked protein
VISIRLKSTKDGKIRFTSHRDVARIWERSLRIAGVPMVYSEGYSPRPRIAFGLALPTGSESDGEYIDIQLDDERPREFEFAELPERLTAALPEGLTVCGVSVLESKATSLQQAVTSCEWDITVNQTIDELINWTQQVLESSSIVVTRERKGKQVTDDLRPYIRSLDVIAPEASGGDPVLSAELVTQPRSLRPSELLAAAEPHLTERRLRRRHQWIEQEGARLDPLEVGAAPVPHTTTCAS